MKAPAHGVPDAFPVSFRRGSINHGRCHDGTPTEAQVEFRILGPLEVLDRDRVVSLPRGRGRALLALLVVQAAQVVGTERLIDELWGDAPPPTVRTALQGLVSRLRKSLQPAYAGGGTPSVLRTEPAGYVLDVDPVSIDAHRFRRLLERAHGLPAAGKAPLLRDALALWRGPALADFTYEPFAQQEAATLEELRLAAVEERVDADLALGRHGTLVAELEALVAAHPFRERLHGQLMLALYRAGRQAEALEAYQVARRILVDDLGVEPNPQLRRLEQAILQQDASLVPDPVDEAGQRPWLPRHRRMVTAVSVPITAAPDAAAALDPEALERLSDRARDATAAAITGHGGMIVQTTSDELCGLFGVHTAHEDDTLRAARAGADARDALVALNQQIEPRLPVRVGIETGEVVVALTTAELPSISGAVASSAARLQRTAPDGEVLVGATARRLLRDSALLEPLTRGGGTTLSWRLAGLVPGAAAVPRRLDAPLFGRTAELARIHGAFERAIHDGMGHRLTVLGEPGIGKSRLARELVTTVSLGARTLTGHCPAYGEGMAFWPLREIVLQAAGPEGPDALAEMLGRVDDSAWTAAQVAGAVGLTGEPGRPDELFPAVRRLFEALAADGPVVVVLEDMHWAQPTLLDLVEYLDARTRGAVLFLCLARPELLDERPSWGEGAGALVVGALGRDETERLATDRLRGRALSREALQQVVESAQGNPLFVEQLVAAYEDEGTGVAVPASVRALLASRLDRLGPGERDLLRYAGVVGADVPVDALFALVPAAAAPFVHRHLGTLERKQLILSAPDRFRFRHALIRHAAYQSMTHGDRARLHERYAEWLGAELRQAQPELDEIIGYHLEQAAAERRASGIEDGHTAKLATRAGWHLAEAGSWAFSRVRDMAAAANLMSRARSLLPASHPRQ